MAFQVKEVQRYLEGADYPINGKELADLAKQNGPGTISWRPCAGCARSTDRTA